MTIVKSTLPDHSVLYADRGAYDYIDCYQGEFAGNERAVGSVEIGTLFFKSGPTWMDKLFVLRNKIVGLFGLKNLR